MRYFMRREAGMTLLEVMLVIVIAAVMILMGLRQYQTLKVDSDIRQAKYNMDVLFNAASGYYQGNCRRERDSSGAMLAGTATLDDPSGTVPNPFPLPIEETLRAEGYLTQTYPLVRFVDAATAGGGYVVQLNKQAVDDRTFISAAGKPIKVGRIIIWKIQVAMRITNPVSGRMTQYSNLLGADCQSKSVDNGETVLPCNANPSGPYNYLVWERLPSFASPSGHSTLWPTNPTVTQFEQMYSTAPASYLAGLPASEYPAQNFLCGS